MRPEALTGHAAHKHETVLVADDGHATVVRPRKVRHRIAAVVYELDGPAALVFHPHVDDAFGVASGQLLIGLLKSKKTKIKVNCNEVMRNRDYFSL